jgi:hypothetical protein
MKINVAMLVAAACITAVSAWAHHSFSAEFDSNKSVKLNGAVTKLEWTNPHIWVYLDVKDENGSPAKWQCEGGPPNTLTRNGWSKDSLKAGDTVIIEGWLAKDGSKTCDMRTVKLPDGRSVFAGSANAEAKQ